MKSIIFLAIIIGFIAFVFIFLPLVSNEARAFLSRHCGSNLSKFFLLAFPPNDLYVPLVSSEINVALSGSVIKSKASHKYPGKYEATIVFERNTILNISERPKETGLRLRVEFKNNDEVIKSWIVNPQEIYPGGYRALQYSVPIDIPMDVNLLVTVEVIDGDGAFGEGRGAARLTFVKVAEI